MVSLLLLFLIWKLAVWWMPISLIAKGWLWDEEFKKNTISPNSLREMASILSKEYNDKLSLDVNVEYYDFICKMFNFNANDMLKLAKISSHYGLVFVHVLILPF